MSDGLFNPEAFEQMPGQMSMEAVESTFSGDEKEAKRGAVLVIDHAHIEIMKRHGARMDRAWRGES